MRLILLIVSMFTLYSCQRQSSDYQFTALDLNKANYKLLEVAMEDGFPPPIASRVYVYPHIAAYTVLQLGNKDLKNISPQLNSFPTLVDIDTTGANLSLAAIYAFNATAQKVVFSEHYMQTANDSLLISAKKNGLSKDVIEASKKLGNTVATQIKQWLLQDNYIETRTMPRFTSDKSPGKWTETPPDYIQGLEPHWYKIRPLTIDSAGIYQAEKIPAFDTQKGSRFYQMAMRVYTESNTLDQSKKDIAWFWDDNPNTSDHNGHSSAIIHKISPPGHWLNIISQISAKNKLSLTKTSELYTLTAIAMFDGIISTWHQKYKSNLIRPITYIQNNIDPNWKPLIQTPPFPEYTSGHSVISASAATVLTSLLGENYSFSDHTSTLYGGKERTFKSFQDAAWEVSLSRFYGGIHFYNGIEEGNKQGKFIGNLVLNKLK
jgi:hypothetical protein